MTVTSDSIIPGGIYTPITTFFKNNGKYSLDLEAQVDHAKVLYGSGIRGVVAAGSMGECSHLSAKERHQLVAAIREGVPDEEFKIIAGAPPLCIQDAIEESISAKEAGADFIILLVPGYFGPHLTSQEGIVDYFTRVADQSALPIMIYNYPGVTNNVSISIDTFRQLGKHPNISGVKLTHFNLDMYAMLGMDQEMDQNNFRPFTGLGQVLVPGMSVGLFGAIDGLSGIFPKTMVKLYDLFTEGKMEEASKLQYLVAKADQMIPDFNLVGTKLAIKKYHGLGECFTGRPPLSVSADKEKLAKYDADLDAIYEVEKSL